MKKVLLTLLTLFMVVGLTACGKSISPSESLAKELESLKPQIKEMVSKADASDLEELKQFDINPDKVIDNFVTSFEYEILGEEEKSRSEATVDLRVKTYDFAEVMDSVILQLVDKIIDDLISGSEFDEDSMMKEFGKAINDLDMSKFEKSSVNDITVDMVKESGVWKLAENGYDKLQSCISSTIDNYDYEARLEDILYSRFEERSDELAAVAPFSDIPTESLSKSYKLTKLVSEGTTYEGSLLDAALVEAGEVAAYFYEDGTVLLNLFGQTVSGTDTGSSIEFSDGSSIDYTVDGDKLSMSVSGNDFEFSLVE